MRLGKIRNKVTGEIIEVTATTEHPDSHYGHPVWVDKKNIAYIEVDCKIPHPVYEIVLDTNEDRKRIGRQIAELREKKGLSTRQLADASGVNYSNIGKIERGAYNVSVDILSKICKALDAEIIIKGKAKK